MTFGEKVEALTKDRNRADVARAAGILPSAINNYVNRGSEPMASAALKIARALGVTIEWLIDDTQGLPAKKEVSPSARSLSDDELMLEVCRRWRIEAVRYWHAINKAEKVDWTEVADRIVKLPFDAPIPASLQHDVMLAAMLNGFHTDLLRYDPSFAALGFEDQLPGDEIDADEMMMERLENRWHEIRERGPGWQIVRDWQSISTHRRSADEAKEDEQWRERSIEKLNRFRQQAKRAKA